MTEFTPVHLLTGFLGSGKTTLLQRLLADPALADTAVLINEFGEVGLDHHLLERIDGQTVLLPSGCLCCTIRGELADSLRDLLSKRARGTVPPFARVVMESTGLADPFPVLSTLHADPVLRHHLRAGTIVTTVDAVNGCAQFDRQPESVKQVAVADRIVVTKSDLADPAPVEGRIRALNPAAPMTRAAEGPLDAGDLLGGAETRSIRSWLRADAAPPPHDANRHGADIRAFALSFDRPLDWTAFGLWLTMLLNRHGASVLRVKGILDVEGMDAPVAIHGVQHLVHPPVHMAAWPDEERCSRIVFIVQGLDPAAIRRSLDRFLALEVAPA